MRKSYKFQRHIKIEKNFYYNHGIKAPQVMIIDENNENIGVMNTKEAIALAEERGYDLVEVSPTANPPVARIMNFGSFQYQREKQLKKQKAQTKNIEMKGIRLSIKISEHDQDVRVKQADKFLQKGHKLKVEVILRGREMQHFNLARQILISFKTKLTVPTQIEQDVSKQGNKVFLILTPAK